MYLPRAAFAVWTAVAVASAASCVVMAELRMPLVGPVARRLEMGAEKVVGVAESVYDVAGKTSDFVKEAAGKAAETAVGAGEAIKDHVQGASEIKDEIASKAKGAAEKAAGALSSAASKVAGELVGGFLELLQLNDTCVGEAEDRCKEVVRDLVSEYLGDGELPSSPSELWEALKERIPVHPGTKWCGAGNVARSFDDRGVLKETDACCREHDNCPDNIQAGGQKHGLNNTGSFTRSNCECDRTFYKCLKSAETLVASKIGFIYFDVLRPNCFEKTYPVIDCESRSKSIIPHCNEYKFDYSGQKKYQWFDNPLY